MFDYTERLFCPKLVSFLRVNTFLCFGISINGGLRLLEIYRVGLFYEDYSSYSNIGDWFPKNDVDFFNDYFFASSILSVGPAAKHRSVIVFSLEWTDPNIILLSLLLSSEPTLLNAMLDYNPPTGVL